MTDVKKIKFPSNLLTMLRSFLESKLVSLKRQKKNLKNADPFMDEDRANENSFEDDLDEQIGHFDSEIKEKIVKKQIIETKKALKKIDTGDYGICEKCGKMIDTDRLSVIPDTTVCIKCEKEIEA